MTEIEMAAGIENMFLTTPSRIPLKRNRGYRRKVERVKNDQVLKIIKLDGYRPHVGYVDGGFDGSSLLHSGKHIKYPKDSHKQRKFKRTTSKLSRKQQDVPHKGNFYRRLFDYQWSLY